MLSDKTIQVINALRHLTMRTPVGDLIDSTRPFRNSRNKAANWAALGTLCFGILNVIPRVFSTPANNSIELLLNITDITLCVVLAPLVAGIAIPTALNSILSNSLTIENFNSYLFRAKEAGLDPFNISFSEFNDLMQHQQNHARGFHYYYDDELENINIIVPGNDGIEEDEGSLERYLTLLGTRYQSLLVKLGADIKDFPAIEARVTNAAGIDRRSLQWLSAKAAVMTKLPLEDLNTTRTLRSVANTFYHLVESNDEMKSKKAPSERHYIGII